MCIKEKESPRKVCEIDWVLQNPLNQNKHHQYHSYTLGMLSFLAL